MEDTRVLPKICILGRSVVSGEIPKNHVWITSMDRKLSKRMSSFSGRALQNQLRLAAFLFAVSQLTTKMVPLRSVTWFDPRETSIGDERAKLKSRKASKKQRV